MKNKKWILAIALLLLCARGFCADITFKGGYSSVSLQDGNHRVTLSNGARVETDDFSIVSDKIELYGDNYRYVQCTGNVIIIQKDKDIELKCTNLVFDRDLEILTINGWVEVDDREHEAKLSGAWLEYNTETNIMKIQMRAKIEKNTDDGLLSANADSIEFDNENQTLVLKGSSTVLWDGNNYSASVMMVDIEDKEITLYDSITGEING